MLRAIARAGVCLLLPGVVAAGCRASTAAPTPQIVQPGAPGQPSRIVTAAQAADVSRVRHTPADVRFMQRMIAHHAQAVEMVALLSERTAREAMRLLGRRIELSQADEIAMMQDWLRSRGEAVAAADAHAGHGGAQSAAPMPGMLTAEEMRRLAAARGDDFDRLFLELMIKHHSGALVMVEELLAQPGAAQEPDLFAFVSDIEADQRMEIERMAAMLKELQQ